jgi:hypothetical protein
MQPPRSFLMLQQSPTQPATCPDAVLSDTADHLRTSLKPMLTKLRSVSGIA